MHVEFSDTIRLSKVYCSLLSLHVRATASTLQALPENVQAHHTQLLTRKQAKNSAYLMLSACATAESWLLRPGLLRSFGKLRQSLREWVPSLKIDEMELHLLLPVKASITM